MINRLSRPILAGCALLLCSCAAPTSVKETWTSPSYTGGPVGSVAVLAVTEQGMIRTGLENRFARELGRTVETVVPTHKYLSLSEIKEDKEAAATRLHEAGVQTVLITRLTSSEEQAHSVRVGNERYSPVVTGYSPGVPYGGYHGWHGYYTLAFQDMGTVWSSQTKKVYLETSLFDLGDGQRLWSCLTKTVLKESSDVVEEEERLAVLIIGTLRKDGMVE